MYTRPLKDKPEGRGGSFVRCVAALVFTGTNGQALPALALLNRLGTAWDLGSGHAFEVGRFTGRLFKTLSLVGSCCTSWVPSLT